MAASSSSSSSLLRTWKYDVFASFHGPDVRKSFLSHFRKQFNYNGISMFDDQRIVRSHIITPSLTEAIGESRISIVILSKNYASSSWCLDELLKILCCKEDKGQIVMTIFYGVDPSHVRKQIGDFGIAFDKTCAGKTEDEKKKWSQALTDAANIAGEDFLKWDNEADMMEKIAKDVSDKLNATPSRDFDGMVGLEDHLRKILPLLDLYNDGVKIVAISGPAGIGKSTIARALHNRLSNMFHLTCFLDNLRARYPIGLDECGMKLHLQEELLSMILNQTGIRICHLGVIAERLCNQRVFIVLDDVNNIKQLEALAGDISWFGPRSRIVVTTENQVLLQLHGINNTYNVGFPSHDEALEILSRYAFSEIYPHSGFEVLALRVAELCGNLPLGLRVVGSSLRGKNEEEWEEIIRRLETLLDHQDIEEVLSVGYESLHENEQSLFLHIAVFFNFKKVDVAKAMFADSDFNILVNRSLIYITDGEIVMHKLLQQVATKIIRREEPWKRRRILIDAQEICDVLELAQGTRGVSGISFDIYDIDDLYISNRAFKRMPNLQFLKVYKSKDDGNDILHIPEEMELPRRLRLLDWKEYPGKCLPPTFNAKYLVELDLKHSKLKKLWDGTQTLSNLKKMNMEHSLNLKELPDLSKATNLETLILSGCSSLVEITSSIANLHKLEWLDMALCSKLQVVPTLFNLASLGFLNMNGCSQLRNYPDISTNIESLYIDETLLKEFPRSLKLCFRIETLYICGDGTGIEKFPDCFKDLHGLEKLGIINCPKLASLPELPCSLKSLAVEECESMEKLMRFPFGSKIEELYFTNCFRLGQEARRIITQQSLWACLPGITIPEEFFYRTIGNSLTIYSDFDTFKICVVVSVKQQHMEIYNSVFLFDIRINGLSTYESARGMRGEHLYIAHSDLVNQGRRQDNKMLFEFIPRCQQIEIIECGVQILKDPTNRRISSQQSHEPNKFPMEATS